MNQQIIEKDISNANYYYQNNQLPQAIQICRDILLRSPLEPRTLVVFVSTLLKQGNTKQAVKYLKKEAKKYRNNSDALNKIGVAMKHIGELDEARHFFQNALQLDKNNAHVAFNLGTVFNAKNNTTDAKKYYRMAITSKPDFSEAMAELAKILANENETDAAIELCNKVLDKAAYHALANITLAKIYSDKDEHEKIIKLLQPLIEGNHLPYLYTTIALDKIAKAKEKLKDYQGAFLSFKKCNDFVCHNVEKTVRHGESIYAPESLDRIQRFFAEHSVSKWANRAPDDGYPAPVFLVGFPRSGTTLLDQILTSHNAIHTLEEHENLKDIYDMYGHSESDLKELNKLNEATIRHYRKCYWKKVLQNAAKMEKRDIIIDKLPMNTVMLGHIYRFFPEAKIIFVLRDPRDTCMSCYQQNFVITEAMFPFLKLESTVSYYNKVMTLGDYFRKNLPLSFITIHYEDVISDFRNTIASLIEFLDIEWDENVLNFQETARNRQIRTPSSEQVVKPLYKSSIGKWKPYNEFLKPHWQKLDIWVDKLGYR